MAKDAIDNGGAGRAAKGATLVTCSNQAHFHHLELLGVWKCVLLFTGDFVCCLSFWSVSDRIFRLYHFAIARSRVT